MVKLMALNSSIQSGNLDNPSFDSSALAYTKTQNYHTLAPYSEYWV